MHRVTGRTALAQALYRRLSTEVGGLWYDNEYGYDITRYINTAQSPTRSPGMIAQAINAECLKDERVLDCATKVSIYDASNATDENPEGTMTLEIIVTDEDGTFSLTDEAGNIAEILESQ
jgi:hypothetical protein